MESPGPCAFDVQETSEPYGPAIECPRDASHRRACGIWRTSLDGWRRVRDAVEYAPRAIPLY